MYLPLGTFSPDVKLGLVSASRNCFPRELSEKRTKRLLDELKKFDTEGSLDIFVPEGDSSIIETKVHASDSASQMKAAGCDGAVLYLGNFSPEIEDAVFVKEFDGPVMIIAAAEESRDSLENDRGDALCGMLSAVLAVKKRGLMGRVYIPEIPLVTARSGASNIARFFRIIKIVKGIRNATLGLFGPRPRDFETCNYNIASLTSLGVEVEELGLFDLARVVDEVKAGNNITNIVESMSKEVGGVYSEEFFRRLGAYEKAVLKLRDDLKLSGMATQCWSEQEETLRHVPCYINARMAGMGFPIACENDVYSLVAELLGQYATDQSVTILDLNHTIPPDLDPSISDLPTEDLVGLFHCGNTDLNRMKDPKMKAQVIMKRMMEPDGEPDITRGTIEGQISPSPITVLQFHGLGDDIQAYIIEGEFLDIDPATFGSTGVVHIPGFGRLYRHVLLGNFHHHAAIAFEHVGGVLFDAMRLLGVEKIYTPNPDGIPYPDENVFKM